MEVKIKKLFSGATLPSYSTEDSAGMDVVAFSKDDSNPQYTEYGLGWSIEIPKGYVGFIFPRSSVSKYDLDLANAVACIDADFRGEVKLRFRRIKRNLPEGVRVCHKYNVGEKIGQLIIMPYPKIELKEVDELSKTVRGEGGFGSTGV